MKQYRNVLLVFALVLGILGAACFRISAMTWLLLLIGIAAFSVYGHCSNRFLLINWLLLLTFIISSGLCFAWQRESYIRILTIYQPIDNHTLSLVGAIVQPPIKTEYGSKFLLKVTNSKQLPSGKIMVYSSNTISPEWFGKSVVITGKLKVSPISYGLPDYLENKKIVGKLNARNQIKLINASPKLNPLLMVAYNLRRAMNLFGSNNLTTRNYSLLQGMIFGEDLVEEGEEGELVDKFRKTGTIHLLTVSGLHIGFVVAGLTLILRLLKISEKIRAIPILIFVSFYMLMTGLEPPVVRAGLMFGLYIVSKYLGAGDNCLNRLSLAVIIILFINPYNLFEAGFQLSVMATLGVVWLFPILSDYFSVKNRIISVIWRSVLLSISAQLMIIPIIIVYFNQVSWLAPLYNLILIIPAYLTVSTGLLGELLGICIPQAGKLILLVTDMNLHFIWRFMIQFGSVEWIAAWMPSWPLPWIICYYVVILLVLDWMKPNLITGKRNWRFGAVLIGALIVGNLVIWTSAYYYNQEPYFEVVMLDVGQGDAILLRSPDGNTALVDGGDIGSGRYRILPYLRQEGIKHLDLVFGTHGHQDHLGGLDEVLMKIPTRQFYLPENIDWQSTTVKRLNQKIKTGKFSKITAFNGKTFTLGSKVRGRVFHIAEKLTENDNSLVIHLQYGKNAVLLTGDLSQKGEQILTNKYPHLLKATVLKVGHHGSNNSTTMPFITQIKPKVALVSAGLNNRFGHPSKKSLNRLRSLGTKLYRTDLHGTVRVKIFQEHIEVTKTN